MTRRADAFESRSTVGSASSRVCRAVLIMRKLLPHRTALPAYAGPTAMRLARDILLDVFGAYLVMMTLLSAVRSTILPRGVRSPIAGIVYNVTRLLFRLRSGRSPTYERRDRVMAMYGPVALLLLLSTWYLLFVVGFTALYLGTGESTLESSFKLSGSAVFTLGTSTTSHFIP